VTVSPARSHERERLEHGVVQVRSHVSALFGTDAVAPFDGEFLRSDSAVYSRR